MLAQTKFFSLFTLALFSAAFITSCSFNNVHTAVTNDTDTGFLADAADLEARRAAEIVKAKPDSPAGYLQLASVYIRRGRETGDHTYNKKAQSAIDSALALEPKNISARQLHATLLASAHKFIEARDAAGSLTSEFPNDAFAYGILVDANIELGNYDEAIEAAQKMVDLKPNSASFARVGQLRSLHGDHKGAIELVTKAARSADPIDKEAQSWCLMQLSKEHFRAGDIEKAIKVVDESLQISPEYPLALIEKARFVAANGDLNGAEIILWRVNERVPLTEASIMLGDISRKRGNIDEATQKYAVAEESERANDGDIHRFALLWADNDVRLDEALAVAEGDYQTNKDIYASDILAWCLLKNGRTREAKTVMSEALKIGTKDARLYYHAGMIEKALGNKVEARRFLDLALKTNPVFDLIQADNARNALATL